MITRDKEELTRHETHAKECHSNTSKTVVAAILLNVIVTLRVKSMSTNQGKSEVPVDNTDVWKRLNIATKVAIHINQDHAAEIIAIKKMIKEVDLDVMLIREKGYREVRQAFHQNNGPVLILMCDGKEKEIRINAANKEASNSMRHHGEKVIMKSGQIESFLVK